VIDKAIQAQPVCGDCLLEHLVALRTLLEGEDGALAGLKQ
jgi:hypothetical protein